MLGALAITPLLMQVASQEFVFWIGKEVGKEVVGGGEKQGKERNL
jgi:hypothetical protein